MKSFLIRRALLGAALSLAGLAAHAQGYPSRPIQVIVPVSAGGPTDTVARVMAQRLGERLGQSVVVQNILGAGGVVGTDQFARSRPDGYTLYMGVNSLAIYPNVRPPNNPLPFNVLEFTPLGGVAESAHVFVAGKAAGVRNIAEFVAAAKQKPEALSYGSAGVGGTTHLPPAFFAHQAGVKLLHVPYKGAAPAMQDTIAGRVSMSAPGYNGALDEMIRTGTLVPLAVTSAKRLPFLPNVPTLAESGYPDMVFPIWYALYAPKGTPSEVVTRLSNELREMAQEPEYARRLYTQGNIANYVPPERMQQILADDIKRLAERIKASGINVIE